jgi:hypothetical protein
MAQAYNTWGTPNNTVGNLNGLFKETYDSQLHLLIPDGVKLLNMIKFGAKEKMPGNLFHSPVILGLEHGITFASSTDDAFNLMPPIAGQIKDAQVRGSPAVLRSVLGYTAAARAAQGNAQSFMDATKFLVANMLRSMAKKIEIEMFYGGNNILINGAQTGQGYGLVDTGSSGTSLNVQVASWAPGIWAGSENMPIEVRDPTGATVRGQSTVASVSFTSYNITLSSAIPGMTANDVIWHLGAYGNEFIGVHQIVNLQTGTLFNINVGTYNLFRGNQYVTSGALSFGKLNLGTVRAVEKGLEGKVSCFVNPRGWANMLNDQAALRKYDGSWSRKRLENGSEALTFYAQNGEIEIIPSLYVKEGFAYILALEDFMRVGSTDITFKRPGQADNFFRDLDSAAGYELRCFTDQALFCMAPGKQVCIIGIVNQTS